MPTNTPAEAPAPAAFAGYGRPRYTQTPNLFFDEHMQELSLSELRVLLYIFRRTFGFQRDGDTIALRDFLSGRQAADGRPLDRGAGVSESSLLAALQSLEARGFLFRHLRQDARQGHRPTYYELNIDGQRHCTADCRAPCPPSPKTYGEGPPETYGGASPQTYGEGPPETYGEPSPATYGEPSPETYGELSIDERKRKKETPPSGHARHIPTATRPDAVVVVAVEARGGEQSGSRRPPASATPVSGSAADVAAITRLLTEHLQMTAGQARKYARIVVQQDSSQGYVERLIQAAHHTPNVHNPAGLVAHWIMALEEPPVPGAPEIPQPGLDPQKYLHGKYAHLFNRPSTPAAEETL